MTTKHSILIYVFLLFSILSNEAFPQESTVIAQFIIQDARANKVDITEQWVKDGAYFAIYTTEGSDNILFASINPKQNTQSYGRIFDLKVTEQKETSEEYHTETFNFKWSYINDYDDKKGTANVQLVKIHKAAGIAFTCTIIPENLDVLSYKGFMKGSLKTLD